MVYIALVRAACNEWLEAYNEFINIMALLAPCHDTEKGCPEHGDILLAEEEGFKPPIPERGIPDFESSAFGHSAILP